MARRLGLSEWQVRKLLAQVGLAGRRSRWTEPRPDLAPDDYAGVYTADDYLRDNAGERSKRRLAREIGCSASALRLRLSSLGLRPSELRTDLTVSQVALLIGRSEDYVRTLVHRRALPWRRVDGVWRVWPSELRTWLLEDAAGRVEWGRVPRDELPTIVGLLVGAWGVSEDHKRSRRRRRGVEDG
jgi:hypothetical protein